MKLFSGHFRALLTFSGRENREPFWLWVLIVYGAQTIIGMAASIPMVFWMFRRVGHAIAAHDRRGLGDQRAMFHDMAPLMGWLGVVSAVLGTLFMLSVAAAVVRRLHDGNRSGWWVLPAGLLHIGSQVSGLAMLARGKLTPIADRPFAVVQQSFGLIQFAGLLVTVILIVVLVLPGTNGDNRFGPDPLALRRRR